MAQQVWRLHPRITVWLIFHWDCAAEATTLIQWMGRDLKAHRFLITTPWRAQVLWKLLGFGTYRAGTSGRSCHVTLAYTKGEDIFCRAASGNKSIPTPTPMEGVAEGFISKILSLFLLASLIFLWSFSFTFFSFQKHVPLYTSVMFGNLICKMEDTRAGKTEIGQRGRNSVHLIQCHLNSKNLPEYILKRKMSTISTKV